MKKKAICMILVFLFAFAGSVPAYAAASVSDADIWVTGDVCKTLSYTSEGVPEGCTPLTESEMALFCEPADWGGDLEANETDIVPYALHHYVYAVETSVYPLAVNVNTYEGFYNTSIGRSITYTTYYQMAALMLSNEDTLQMMADMVRYLSTLEGEYQLAGWYVYTKIFFQAEYPKSATITPSETCLLNPGEISLSIPYQQSTYAISRPFGYPTDKNPLEDVYTVGFDGMFTFKDTSNGVARSLPYNSVVMFNKPN